MSGSPIYQLWLAATVASVSGVVSAPDPSGVPVPVPGAGDATRAAFGSPGRRSHCDPVTTTTGADGSFALDGVVTGPYLLVVDPPIASGLAPAVIPIDLTAGDVSGITVTLTPVGSAG